MKYLFAGLGSIGQRHLTNLRTITDEPILAYRTTSTNLNKLNQQNITTYTNLNQALSENPDVTFITNPTTEHLPIAIKAAQQGSHLFIEKPISHNLEQIDQLFSLTKTNNKLCFVGFNMRFHPNLIKIKELLKKKIIGKVLFSRIQVGQYLPNWHPEEDYRKSYSAKKELGGGVVLTLIHEIDYAYWLFGEIKEVTAFTEKLSSLEIDVEDTAAIIMKTRNNSLIEVHLDYLQNPPVRNCEVIGEKGKIVWDYFTNEVKLYTNESEQWITFKEEFERNDMYKKELGHFLNCIKNNQQPAITPKEIKDVMLIIEAIKKSANEKRTIILEKKEENN